MIGDLLLLWLAAFPLMGSPGPATLSLASLGATYGVRTSVRYLGGIIAGTTAVLLIIATGVTAVLAADPVVLTVLQIAAAAYIVYLAWKIGTARFGDLGAQVEGGQKMALVSFVAGFGLAIANPKAFAAIGAVYSGHVIFPENPALDAAAKVAALTLVIAIVNTAWLAFGASFARFLTNPAIGRPVSIVFALLLIASVGLAMAGG